MPPPPSPSLPRILTMIAIMTLGFFLLTAFASAPRLAPWTGGSGDRGHRHSVALLMAPAGAAAMSSTAVQPPTGDDVGVLTPPPAATAAPDTVLSSSHVGGRRAPTTGRAAAKPRRLLRLPPSGPSNRGHV